ncbi:MAG: P-loop NTPase fold protein [Eubacteriales bacterium]
MKGDIIVLEPHHIEAGAKIAKHILSAIKNLDRKFIITVSGESGSGKSETAKAISDEMEKEGIKSTILGQDDYFVLPPKSNDLKRREDSSWLGPHVEVKMDLLNQSIAAALEGEKEITKPIISYDENDVSEEKVKLEGIDVLILEGTYTALLRNVDCKVFINRNRLDTLEHRKKRNRGNEVGDPFIEDVLKTEHKIIAGHQFLADIIITKDYEVIIK